MSFSHFTTEETDAWEKARFAHCHTSNLGKNQESESRLLDPGLEPPPLSHTASVSCFTTDSSTKPSLNGRKCQSSGITQDRVEADPHPYTARTVSLTESGVNLHKENLVSVLLCCSCAEQELMAVSGAKHKCK